MHPVELLTSGAKFWWADSSFISPRCRPKNKHTLNREWAFICIPLCDTQGTSAEFPLILVFCRKLFSGTISISKTTIGGGQRQWIATSMLFRPISWHTLFYMQGAAHCVLNHSQSMLWQKKRLLALLFSKNENSINYKTSLFHHCHPPPSPSFSPGGKLFI